jgi:hypothetical protein
MTIKLTWQEYQRIKDLKVLDLEICDYRHINILNLGWEPFKKFNCLTHKKEHVLCPELCYKVSLNILKCELRQKRNKRNEKPVKTNKSYSLCSCYLCGKELKGAGHHGVIKNRNNPGFWGIGNAYKVLCLECIGKEFYGRMSSGKKKTFRKYLKRGYV